MSVEDETDVMNRQSRQAGGYKTALVAACAAQALIWCVAHALAQIIGSTRTLSEAEVHQGFRNALEAGTTMVGNSRLPQQGHALCQFVTDLLVFGTRRFATCRREGCRRGRCPIPRCRGTAPEFARVVRPRSYSRHGSSR